MIKAIYFDLFFTLIVPRYENENNEFTILGITAEEWEYYAENDALYRERALGLVKNEKEIIEKIAAIMPFEMTDAQRARLLAARENRMKAALNNVSKDILEVLRELKAKGLKLGLISNADVIDCKYWQQSPLAMLFDDVIFSCDVGILKPDREIYELALANLEVKPNESMFVGDGGSNELKGAKTVGMRTVFTEVFDVKGDAKRAQIMEAADYHIREFRDISDIVV